MLYLVCWVGGMICGGILGIWVGTFLTIKLIFDRLIHVLEERGYIDAAARSEAKRADMAEVGAD